MKPASEYASEQEILAERVLPTDLKHRADLLDEWRATHPPEPPAPTVVSTDERNQIAAHGATLKTAGNEWTTNETKGKKYSDMLPGETEKVRVMAAAIEPESAASDIQNLLIAERRLQVMQAFVANVPRSQELIQRRIFAALSSLNHLLEQRGGPRFYLAGTSPVGPINAALACITQLLDNKP